PGQGQVEARFGAVAVHAGKQDLAGPVTGHLPGPLDRIDASGLASSVSEDLPARGVAIFGCTPGINCHHNALRAVIVGGCLDQLRVGDRGAVDRDFISAGIEQTLNVGNLAYTPTHRKWNKDFRRYRLDNGQNKVAVVAGRRDVQKGEFVGTLLVVAPGNLDGITGINQVDEIHAFYDPACSDVQTRDNAPCQRIVHGDISVAHDGFSSSARSCASAKSMVPS